MFVFLRAMPVFVCLNTLVIFLVCECYVNVVHFFNVSLFHFNTDGFVLYLSVYILWKIVFPHHYSNSHSFLFSLVLLEGRTFWRCEILKLTCCFQYGGLRGN